MDREAMKFTGRTALRKGSQLLSSRPNAASALSGAPVIAWPGEQLVLKAVPSTPLNTLARGMYT